MKIRKFLILGTAILLSSCNGTNDTSSKEENSSLDKETALSEALEAMEEGYTSLGIYKYGYEYMGYSYKYVEASSKKKEYTCKSYKSSSSENPSLDSVESNYRYAPNKIGYRNVLCEFELGFDNELHYNGVVDSSGNYISWSNSGYGNRFNLLSTGNFSLEDDGYYSLAMDADDLSSFYESLGSQLTGLIGLTLASFKVKLEGNRFTDYFASFDPIETSYGNYYTEVKGKFTAYGEDVIPAIETIAGEEDATFLSAMSKLKEQNYHLDISLSSKSLSVDVEDGANVIYDLYNKKGAKTNSYGYYQKTINTVQGIIKINNKVYPDSAEISGYMTSLLPTFEMSSLFFDKSEESGAKIYTLKDDAKCSPSSQDYGTMAGSTIGSIKISVFADKIVIENKLKLSTEVFTYSKFGEIKGLIENLEDDASSLKWSDLLSNQEAETSILYKNVSSNILDEIPTFGGDNLMVVLDASYNKSKPVIALAFDDYNSGVALQASYLIKLKDAGFIETKNESTGDFFTKKVTINGEEITIGALVYLAADYFETTQLLLYPSIVK